MVHTSTQEKLAEMPAGCVQRRSYSRLMPKFRSRQWKRDACASLQRLETYQRLLLLHSMRISIVSVSVPISASLSYTHSWWTNFVQISSWGRIRSITCNHRNCVECENEVSVYNLFIYGTNLLLKIISALTPNFRTNKFYCIYCHF